MAVLARMMNSRPSLAEAARPFFTVTPKLKAAGFGEVAGRAARGARQSIQVTSGLILFI